MPDDADVFGELQAAWARLAAAEERAVRAEQEAAASGDRYRRLRGRKIVASALAVAESRVGGRPPEAARRARPARSTAPGAVTVDPAERRGLAVFVSGTAPGAVAVEDDRGNPVSAAVSALPAEPPGGPGRFAGWLDLEPLAPGRYMLRVRCGAKVATFEAERTADGPFLAVEDVVRDRI